MITIHAKDGGYYLYRVERNFDNKLVFIENLGHYSALADLVRELPLAVVRDECGYRDDGCGPDGMLRPVVLAADSEYFMPGGPPHLGVCLDLPF